MLTTAIFKSRLRKCRAVIFIFAAGAASLSFYVSGQNCAITTAANSSERIVFINIEEKRLYLFENSQCIKKYPVASGRPDWPSPIGEWKVIQKSDWGEGFGGRWLGLNVSWGRYGIHGTTKENSIGTAASHGCIRMYNKDVKELYALVPVGTKVIIRNGPYGPFGTDFRNIKPGDRGADVLAVQKRLYELGYFKGRQSGIYGDDLKAAFHKFRLDRALPVKDSIGSGDYLDMGIILFE